ncbi:hypothetical protein Tco_0462152 [Tanacetum coccineum]
MLMLTKPQVFYDEAHKSVLGYQNPLYLRQAQRKQPVLYSGKSLVEKHDAISVCDSEETLILAEESRLKMKDKQKEHNDKPIDYSKLNKLYEYFVPQKQLSTEQLYWSPVSKTTLTVLVVKPTPTQVFPIKLPTTSQVHTNLKNEKDILDKFHACIKKRTILFGVEMGNWRIYKIEDENVSLTFQVSSLSKEREHLKLVYKNLYDSIKQTRAKTKLQADSLQQKLNDQIFENNKLRAQLQAKFSKPQLNQNGTSVNTKFAKPSTSGNKLYYVTPLPKTQLIPKVVEKNDLSKTITSHLHTNKIIDKCTKVLAPGFLKIEYDLINAVSYIDASGSKPRSNTRNDRILLPSSRSQKNNVEAQLRKFKSSSNKNNHVSDCNANVKNVVVSNNSENVCLSCNECLISTNHDACVVKYLKDVQNCKKATYVIPKEKIQWKPTSKVFTLVGLRWKPKRRMFNMEEKICPIIKTSPATIVPSRNRLHTISIPAVTPNAKTTMRYSIAKNSLIRAHINSYGHPFNSLNFAFVRNSAIPEQSSWNFGFLGVT